MPFTLFVKIYLFTHTIDIVSYSKSKKFQVVLTKCDLVSPPDLARCYMLVQDVSIYSCSVAAIVTKYSIKLFLFTYAFFFSST